MYLLGEVLNKQDMFKTFYLLGFELLLTIFMLVYISKSENYYGSIDNMSVKEMLAAAKLQ